MRTRRSLAWVPLAAVLGLVPVAAGLRRARAAAVLGLTAALIREDGREGDVFSG